MVYMGEEGGGRLEGEGGWGGCVSHELFLTHTKQSLLRKQ